MRYMTSRWGYNTSVFAWQLWSELNLTGSQRGSGGIHHRSEVVDWHRLMGRSIRDMDIYDHIISSHVSGDHNTQNDVICMLPEMSSCSVDAYHGNTDPLHIINLMRDTAVHNNRFGKPVLITEFGGSAMAQGLKHMDETLHCAVWGSVGTPIGGTPMFWWWQLVDEENFYPRYAAVARFMAGEDRRDRGMTQYSPEFSARGGTAPACISQTLKNSTRAIGWIARSDFASVEPCEYPGVTNLVMTLREMLPRTCRFQFWDTRTGRPMPDIVLPVQNGSATVPVPPFVRDIAFKVNPVEPEQGVSTQRRQSTPKTGSKTPTRGR
jgi:hypothetical protein